MLITSILTIGSSAIAADSNYKIGVGKYNINNSEKIDVAPYVKNNRTYLPLRFVGYAVGIGDNNIRWDQETQTAFLAQSDKIVAVKVGGESLYINNESKLIDALPEIKDDRIMLPLRAVAEAFDCEVKWYPEYQVAQVITK